jgi:hypothetical protein
LAESSAERGGVGPGELGVVEGIEEFRAKFDPLPLGNFCVLTGTSINVAARLAAKRASLISEGPKLRVQVSDPD